MVKEIAFTLYGARIGVRADSTAALRALSEVFPPGWKPLASAQVDWQYTVHRSRRRSERVAEYVLESNAEVIAQTPELARIVPAFERDVQLAVAQKARRKIFVHAGVVGWQGSAIMIPGRSFTGKSSLVRELVRAGATYYSDEYAVLDQRGRVHPFARPLALRDEKHRNQKIPFAELGGIIGHKPLPVGTILVTKFRLGSAWRPRPVTPGLGALELLANTVTARTNQQQVLEILASVTAQSVILKGTRGDARTFAPQLLQSLIE